MVMLLSTFPRSADAADNQHWLDRKGPAGYFILKFGKGDLVDPDQLDKGGKSKATEYVIFKKTLHHAASMSSRGTKCYLAIVRPEIESPGFALRSPQEVIPRLRLLKTSWQHVARTPEAHVFREYNKRHIEKMWSSLDQPSPNLVRIHLELPWMHKEASYEDDVLYKVAFPCVDALEEFECNFPLELDGLERIHAHLKDFKFFLDRFSFVELPDKAELYTSVKKLDWRVGDWCVHPGSKQMPIETVAYPDADFRSMNHLFRQCASLEELRVWRNQEDPWGGVFIRHFLPYVPRDKPLSRLKRVSFHYPIDWMDELDKSQVTCSYDIEALRRLPPGAEIQPTLLK
ncbi:hypothetical protein PIIN_07342 [Serendipita indica DSM 11827]|uniref:Uncharacterized protein n=1 Tax=Serendipita indica (strain DSM 11827) TaxID=1109443 RepID=G4TPZ5_SERID|nr:hypothetical protein PIIN_07342 [Serendipita indica DSM 11827]